MSSSRSLGLSLVTLLVAVALVGSAAAENPIDLSGEISFESHDGLYVVSANGGTPTKIPGTRVGDGDPALSPDGTQYAFDREQPGAKLNADGDIPRDVYVMQRDGSGVRQLTFNSSDDGWPQWSPSGRSLSFWSDRRGGGIYVVDVESGAARRVVQGGWIPSWTPDGRLLFSDELDRLVMVRSYGAGRQALPVQPGDVLIAQMSPDGQQIVFIQDEGPGMYVTSSDGSNARRLVTSTKENPDDAVWSPDGAWIAFDVIQKNQNYGDIWAIRPDGTGKTRITTLRAACYPDWHAAASP
jgi:TolB protein